MTRTDPLYLITAATGNTGAPTVRRLLNRGHRVRALVHRRDERSESLQAAGAEVLAGDLLDFAAVSAAVTGVEAAYFCYPIAPGLLEATAIFAQAASEAGLAAVVNMSQITARREAVSHAARQHWLGERLLDRTALMTTHLRPTLFAEWLRLFLVRRDKEAVYRLPFADGRHAPLSAGDQANVIAAILENPAPHDRRCYPLFGAVELDHHQIAATVASTLGMPVRYEPIDVSAFAAHLTELGASAHLVQHLSSIAVDYQNGVFAGQNNLVEVISGTKPMTIQEYITGNRAAFPAGSDWPA